MVSGPLRPFRWETFMLRLPAFAALALLTISTLVSGTTTQTSAREQGPNTPGTTNVFGRLPLQFEANVGQSRPGIDFLSRRPGFTLGLSATEAVFSLVRSEVPQRREKAPRLTEPRRKVPAVVRMQLAGANGAARKTGAAPLPGRVNYFLGNDPRRWKRNVPTYGRVRYAEVYPGVDLVYYGSEQRLEYDFVVAPGADPGQIRLSYAGAGQPALAPNGDLLLTTAAGPLRQHRPVVYQEVAGARMPISGEYTLSGDDSVKFALGEYDRTRPLVIDPVLSYSSFLGGSQTDYCQAGALGVDGSYYVTGYTTSLDFPTVDPLQPVAGASLEGFVAKIDPSGSEVVYCTYFGGDDRDIPIGLDLDAFGNVYVTGHTTSRNLPVVQPFQPTFGGGEDGFLLKLNSAGNGISYCTYLGGSGEDDGMDVAVDSQGYVNVAGYSSSTNFPVLHPFYQPLSVSRNAFITRFNPSGTSLSYSSQFGGSNTDTGFAVAVDAGGSAYVVGATSSLDFLSVNPMSFNDLYDGGFLTKISPDGVVQFSGRIGGDNIDVIQDVAVDALGQSYLVGKTGSTNLVPANSLQPAPGGVRDGFLLRINAAGSQVLSGTYLGGSDEDVATAVALDGDGNIGVTGETYSANFPTYRAIQPQNGGGIFRDAFVTLLNPTAAAVIYSTYFGGAGGEIAESLSLDANGNAYLTGLTSSFNFPTVAPFQPAYGQGDYDAFVARIGIVPPPAAPGPVVTTGISQDALTLFWNDNSTDEDVFQIERVLGDGGSGAVFVPVAEVAADQTSFQDSGLAPDTQYTYRVRARNRGGASAFAKATVTTLPLPPHAPSDLQVVAFSQTSAELHWTDASNNEAQFELERQVAGGEFQPLATLAADTTAFLDTGLTPDTTYLYRVRAVNRGGASAYSVALVTTLPLPPGAPTDLSVTALSATQLELHWSDRSDNEAGFEVELRKPDGSYQLAAPVSANAVSVIVGGIRGNGTRTYRVRAVNAGGPSGYSNTASGLTLPEAPRDLAVSRVSQTRLDLRWDDWNEAPAAVQLQRRLTAGGEFDFSVTVAAGVTTYSDLALAPDTEYTYRLRGLNASGTSQGFSEISGRTLPAPPAAPSALTVTASSSTQLILHWTDQSDNETGFEVYRQGEGGAFTLLALLGANAVTFVDLNRQPNVTYTYRVRAVNEGGPSDYTPAQGGLTLPVAPINLVLKALRGHRVEVNWTNQNATPAAHRIERQPEGGAYHPLATVPAGTNTYVDSTASPSGIYFYRVWATNPSGDADSAPETQVSLPGGKLQVPATINFGKVKLGTSATRPLTLKNQSRTESLRVTVGQTTAPYQRSVSGTVTLAPGEKQVVLLVFQPSVRGQAKGTLEITCSDAAKPSLRVKLTGAGK